MLNLRKIREEKRLTQQKLSEKINLSRSTIAMYETSGSEPDLDTLCKLADILNVSVDELLGREPQQSHVIPMVPANELEVSDSKKQLIEMVKELNEDDVMIAMGVIARLNNKPVEDIFKKIN